MIYLLISILLDGILSNIIPMHSHIIPLFTVITLLIIYPKCNKYHMYVLLTGIIYDLLYSNKPFLYLTIFLLMSILIMHLYKDIPNNYLSLIYRIILIIIFYTTVSYLISFLFNYNFNINMLYHTIINSIVINIIYGIILYNILNKNYKT